MENHKILFAHTTCYVELRIVTLASVIHNFSCIDTIENLYLKLGAILK